MIKLRIGIILVGLGIVSVGVALNLLGYFRPKRAGLLIETTPTAAVFIDAEQVGRTSFKATRKPGEIVVKLIPQSADQAFAPFETKVTLVSGIETVIKREFGDSEETSAGEIVSFVKIGGDKASLAVVSVPNAAQIVIDGAIRGFAPYKTSSITAGEHKILVTAPGYLERALSIKTIEGYKLTVIVKLAPSEEMQPTEENPVEESKRTEVEILPTGTGFLRVRSGPGKANEEIARVEPGKRYPFIEEDEETGWFEIEHEEGSQGWISGEYGKKIEPDEEDI